MSKPVNNPQFENLLAQYVEAIEAAPLQPNDPRRAGALDAVRESVSSLFEAYLGMTQIAERAQAREATSKIQAMAIDNLRRQLTQAQEQTDLREKALQAREADLSRLTEKLAEKDAEITKLCGMRNRTLESNRRLLEDNRELRARVQKRAQLNLTQAMTIRRLKSDPIIDWKTADFRPGKLSFVPADEPGRITRHLTPREDELFLEALRNAVGEQS